MVITVEAPHIDCTFPFYLASLHFQRSDGDSVVLELRSLCVVDTDTFAGSSLRQP